MQAFILVINNDFGILKWNPSSLTLEKKLALLTCAGRGPTMGGNNEAREKSFKFAAEFFIKHLK